MLYITKVIQKLIYKVIYKLSTLVNIIFPSQEVQLGHKQEEALKCLN